jgi:hypothetical protein
MSKCEGGHFMNTTVWLSVCLVILGQAGDESEAKVQQERAQRLETMKRAAAEYEVRLDPDGENQLQLQAEPVLRWTNPVRGTTDGAVFLWLAEGRPEAAIGIYKWSSKGGEPDMEHELSSLSLGKLTTIRDGHPVWEPSQGGIALKAIPGAETPADSAVLRLRQLRTLAREFSAFHNDADRPSEELRLLTQPIYRYAAATDEFIDGALFAFVQGTDPEVLLLIEARRQDARLTWQYGLARMTSRALRALHKEEEVWTVPNCWAKVTDRKAPYTAYFRQTVRPLPK